MDIPFKNFVHTRHVLSDIYLLLLGETGCLYPFLAPLSLLNTSFRAKAFQIERLKRMAMVHPGLHDTF